MKSIPLKVFSIALVIIVVASFFAIFRQGFSQTVNQQVKGYGWSDNIGWISFSSKNCDVDADGLFETTGQPAGCPTSGIAHAYGVTKNGSNVLSGYAWSDNIGWVSFNETAGCPSSGCMARISGNTITGWAKALAADGNGWDGWMSMSTQSGEAVAYGPTGSTIGAITTYEGYPWGSDVVGWVDMDMSVEGTGVVVCPNGATNPPACDNGGGDLCLNIADIQTSVPPGTTRDVFGNCNCVNGGTNPPLCTTNIVDFCPNIEGVQSSVPAGMIVNSLGNCVTGTTGGACQPVISRNQTQTIVDEPTFTCALNLNITYSDPNCAGSVTKCYLNGVEVALSANSGTIQLPIGTHTVTCTGTLGGVTSTPVSITPRPQCRLNPNYGNF